MEPIGGVLACGAAVETEDTDGSGGVAGGSICGGAVGPSPTVLARGLVDGRLLAAGDRLALVERDGGRVLSIDRCTGATEVLAELGSNGGAAVLDDVVFVKAGTTLWRVPLGRLHALLEVDPATGAQRVIGHISQGDPNGRVSLIGVGPAGLYVDEVSDCGTRCVPPLQLAPFDGGEARPVPDTEGARSVAVVGESLFVAALLDADANPDAPFDILRMPGAGGETEVLLAGTEEHTAGVRTIVASSSHACWLSYERAPRCTEAGAAPTVRIVGSDGDAEGASMVLTEDALYWLRAGDDGMELVAATP